MTLTRKLLAIMIPVVLAVIITTTCTSYHFSMKRLTQTNLNSDLNMFCSIVQNCPNLGQEQIADLCNKHITIGETGFLFVVSPSGELVIHKKAQGENWAAKPHIAEIIERKNGFLRYLSPKPHTWKVAQFKYLPDRDWIVVAGGFEEDFLAQPRAQLIRANLASGAILTLLASAVCLFFSRHIARSLRVLTDNLRHITRHDSDSSNVTMRRLRINTSDEIGELSRELDTFIGQVDQTLCEINLKMLNLTDASNDLSIIASGMTGNTQKMSQLSASVAEASGEASSQMNEIAAASDQIATNVRAVSASVEQMTTSIDEVARNTEQAATVADQAVTLVQTSNEKVTFLRGAADEIGKVIEVIQDIAEQTNLLALNATIEAARAGDAGKGFAVVANEVKDLARQTAEATEDIARRIRAIQGSTTEAVGAIGEIMETINQVNQVSGMIAAAVEEQNVTTREISQNITESASAAQQVSNSINEAAQRTQVISDSISEVSRATAQTANDAHRNQAASEKLFELADSIQSLLNRFQCADKKFNAMVIKSGHARWKKTLADLLNGRTTLNLDDITNDRECQFGKWYFGEGTEQYGHLAAFRELQQQHHRFHATARQIVQHFNNGQFESAKQGYAELNDISTTLFELLDRVEEQINAQEATEVSTAG